MKLLLSRSLHSFTPRPPSPSLPPFTYLLHIRYLHIYGTRGRIGVISYARTATVDLHLTASSGLEVDEMAVLIKAIPYVEGIGTDPGRETVPLVPLVVRRTTRTVEAPLELAITRTTRTTRTATRTTTRTTTRTNTIKCANCFAPCLAPLHCSSVRVQRACVSPLPSLPRANLSLPSLRRANPSQPVPNEMCVLTS